jgi:hypothetical protein
MSQLIQATRNYKKSVADPTDRYHSLLPLWRKARAVIQGESNVKAHDDTLKRDYSNILIPFSPSMTAAQYEFYKSEAELPGLTSQYCKVLISALLRKESQLQLPDQFGDEAYNWIKNEFTSEGKSLFNFLDTALWEELQTSGVWVYVDRPTVSSAEYDNMTPEERNTIKPYPVILQAENIINIQTSTHPVTRKKTLNRFVTRYLSEKYQEGNPWHPDYVDTVSDHYLDAEGFLVIDVYQKKDTNSEVKVLNGEMKQDYARDVQEGGFEKIDTAYPMMFGKRLNDIPAWPLNGQYEYVEPVLMPIIDREISLYNKVSRRNHLLYGAATYTPVVQSDMTDEEFDTLVGSGLGSWLRVRKDESITVLETPTGALADMDRAIEATVNEMAKMGIRMLSPEVAASGVALEIRNASQTAQLGTLNAKLSGTMRGIIAFMLDWRYGTTTTSDDVKFQLSSDFSPMVGGEGAMRLVSEWYQSGLIPRDTFINIAKYNDFLPTDYDDVVAQEQIQTDPLVNQTPDNQVQIQ